MRTNAATKDVTDCIRCARPVRPFRTRVMDYPGTMCPGARGLCKYCYKVDPKYQPRTAESMAAIAAVEASLAAYLNWRAPFRAKAAKDMT